jgi:hypothetical protein
VEFNVPISDLLPHFNAHARPNHPWWWPCGPGDELGHWGLAEQQVVDAGLSVDALLDSLQHGTRPAREMVVCDFHGFKGSVAPLDAVGTRRWVLAIRPSRSRLQQWGPRWLHELLQHFEILANTRVTDVLKFRGAAPAGTAWAQATEEMRRVSARLLAEQFLTDDPEQVLISGRATLTALKRILKQELNENPQSPHTRVIAEVLARGRQCYFYSAQGKSWDNIRANWADVMAGKDGQVHLTRRVRRYLADGPPLPTDV